MTFDGTPVYYCWKWNVAGGAPEVRITTDIFGQYTATPLDPVNTLAPQELLLRISRIDRTVDTTVIRGLVSAYYRHDMTKHAEDLKEGQNLPSAAVLCFEFGQEGKLGVKSYLAPLNNHQKDHASRDTFEAPVRALYPKNRALDVVSEFLESNGVGKRMVPILMAPDVVPAADARIKYYFYCPCTSFDSIRDVMTLGGRTTGIDDQLHKLKLLIQVISPLPEDFPDDQEIPVVKDLSSYPPHQRKARDSLYRPGYLYYFDIAPGSDLPDIKLYCSTRTYKADDLTIGKGITSWMVAQGQGDYVENYLRVLEGVASPKRLAEYNTLHAYVSFMIKKNGDMDVTSYLMPDRDDCHDPCSFCVWIPENSQYSDKIFYASVLLLYWCKPYTREWNFDPFVMIHIGIIDHIAKQRSKLSGPKWSFGEGLSYRASS